jgi:rhamnose utilization protein RhaD (predicted bifunctional aldolase and dehydrogenase)/NAD(P)-dependent dehydrogenase (short-subunit alcohol dehydrogenase family)
MQSQWNDTEAAAYQGLLAQRVYTSRLLGRDHSLVLHGGGNTSVKIRELNVFGDEEDILYIKGSGWDLETIEAPGFAPVRLERVRRLATLDRLSDPRMVQELRAAMTDPSAPTPSVETILHAILPYRFVDHTHADSLLAITNTTDGEQRIRDIYGDSMVVIPYVMPGFDLARMAADRFSDESGPSTVGMVLLKHGFFSFGETARVAYERMIDLVSRAERYLAEHAAWNISLPDAALEPTLKAPPLRAELSSLRSQVSQAAGFPVVLGSHTDPRSMAFVQRRDLAEISQQGPATPDHVIRTKRLAQLGRDVTQFRDAYERYFAEHAASSGQSLKMLDPAPRIVLDPELGVVTIGRTAQDAAIAFDVYEHTIDIVLSATALGGYHALPASDIFAVEYWDLEQAKLRRAGSPPVYAGEIALVTGAASGIGKAAVEAFLKRGAAVVGLDINPSVADMPRRPDFLGLQCDVSRAADLERALDATVRAFGGLDMLVLNAGIFPSSRRIEALPLDEWRRVMDVNLDANLALLSTAHPLLKCAPRGGRVVVIGSKNVPAPGPGAAAYSASKAALNQLARVAALEWGADHIRVNVVHPNAVFDTGIWTAEVLDARAKQYGLSVDAYKKNNVLGVEITSRDVAELVVEMCGPLFSRTTGAQVPIDGGNDRVI